eukprot:COSAG01_NODE_21548_length_896_cov_14.331242_2_plen_68_part_01
MTWFAVVKSLLTTASNHRRPPPRARAAPAGLAAHRNAAGLDYGRRRISSRGARHNAHLSCHSAAATLV